MKNLVFDLPGEFVKDHVLSALEITDLVKLDTACGSKRIRKGLHILFRNIIVEDAFEIEEVSFLWLKKRSMFIESAIFNDSITDGKLVVMAKQGFFEHVRQFKMEENSSLTSRGLKSALKLFRGICFFLASDCDCIDSNVLAVLAANHPNLAMVNIDRCERVTDAGIRELAQYSRVLEGLHAANCFDISDISIVPLVSNCRELSELVLCNCSGITGATLKALASSPELSHLNLEGNRNITDKDIAAFLRQENVNISTLELRGCDTLTEAGLLTIVKRCPCLTFLDLQACKVTARVVEALVQKGSELLTTFRLLGCPGLTDHIMQKFCEKYPNMEDLRLGNCTDLTDVTLQAVAQNMPGLTDFAVFNNAHYTDRGMLQVVQACVGLSQVEIDACKLLTDATVEAIAEYCPDLTVLSLYRNSNLSDRSIRALAAHSQCLESLNIVTLTVSEEALMELVIHCPVLREIQLDVFDEDDLPAAFAELCADRCVELSLGDLAAGAFEEEDTA